MFGLRFVSGYDPEGERFELLFDKDEDHPDFYRQGNGMSTSVAELSSHV